MATPVVMEGEYRISAITVLGAFGRLASPKARRKDSTYPPTPTINAYLTVLGRTYFMNTSSLVKRFM